jgi:3',5'-cyclic AMP phosphodiesterase CpdA
MGTVRLMHISDVHVGDADPAQLRAARAAAEQLRPDCIVASGDLTDAGRRREFAALAGFLAGLPAPVVACPGNHDVPVFNPLERLIRPFGRFARMAHNVGLLERWASPCGLVRIEAFNSARGIQPRLDWSQGCYGHRFDAAARRLASAADGTSWQVLVCHHPPWTPPGARVASTPRLAQAARRWLSGADRLILLAGHVHGHWSLPLGPTARLVTAPSLGSRRQRGAGAGFTVLDLGAQGAGSCQLWRFETDAFRPVGLPGSLHQTDL